MDDSSISWRRRAAERPNLGVPVVLLLMVSTVMMAVLTFVAARSLDRNADSSAQQVAESLLLQSRRELAKVALEAARSQVVRDLIIGVHDRAWAERYIGRYLARVYGASSVWILDADDRTLFGYLGDREGDGEALAAMSPGLEALLRGARAEAAGQGVHGLLRLNGAVQIGAAARVGPPGDAPGPGRLVLVVTADPRERYLELLRGVYAMSEARFAGALQGEGPSLRLEAPDGALLGYLLLGSAAPGTELLHQVWPAVASAFASMLLLVGLFVRRVERTRLERERLERTLDRERELHNLKARFVNMVSHEIRTPLTTIRAATDLLTRYGHQLTPAERESEFGAIQREVDVMSALVEDVLAIGRTEGAAFQLRRRPVDLEATVRQVWADVARAHGKQHMLELSAPPQARELSLDPSLLRPILSNLLGNAVKFSAEATAVRVAIEIDGGSVAIRVTDRGIGIPADQQEIVFQPFNRASNVGAISGSGLGLTIARQAVERHGGTLRLKSAVGEGTEVLVDLPLAA